MNELVATGKFTKFGIKPVIRRPKYIDAVELASALLESHESLSQFLEWGYKAKFASKIKCFPVIQEDLSQDPPFETYYIFDGSKLIGTSSFSKANQDNGIQVTYWIRQSYQGLGLATWVLEEMRDHAFYVLKADFVEVHTDSVNLGSINVAKRSGGVEWFRYQYESTAWGNSGEMIVWGLDHPAFKIERKINQLLIGQLHRPTFGGLG